MEKKDESNTSIIPIGSTGLVRVSNSIAITEKIIKESNFFNLEDFKGEIDFQINIEEKTHYLFVLEIKRNVLILFSYSGHIITINLLNKTTIRNDFLFTFLKDKINPQGKFDHNKLGRSFCKIDETIYMTTQDGSFYKYDLINSIVTQIELHTNPRGKVFCDIESFQNNIMCYFGKGGRNYINIIDKSSFECIDSWDSIEGFGYDINIENSNYLYSRSHGMNDSKFEGKILKISLIDHSYNIFEVFNDSNVNDFKIINDELIICYSNSLIENDISTVKIIDNKNGKILSINTFPDKIEKMKFLHHEKLLLLLFKDGNVSIFELQKLNLIYKKDFNWSSIIDKEANYLEVYKNKLILGNRQQINIYK